MGQRLADGEYETDPVASRASHIRCVYGWLSREAERATHGAQRALAHTRTAAEMLNVGGHAQALADASGAAAVSIALADRVTEAMRCAPLSTTERTVALLDVGHCVVDYLTTR